MEIACDINAAMADKMTSNGYSNQNPNDYPPHYSGGGIVAKIGVSDNATITHKSNGLERPKIDEGTNMSNSSN